MREGQGRVLVSLGERASAQAEQWLRADGCDVVAPGGASPDVVVAELGAATLALNLRAASEPGPELVVTAAADRLADAVALLRRGACDVLAEPLDSSALVGAVQRALAHRRAASLRTVLLEFARAVPPPRIAGLVAHEIANPVAVLVSARTALDADLAALAEGGALLAPGGELAPAAAWWAREGSAALADAREVAGEAAQAVERLQQLARDRRSLLRTEPGAGGPTATDLASAVAIAVRLARPLLASLARLELDAPAGVSAIASPGAVARVVLEVLLSAADAIAAAGRRRALVRVACRAEAGWAVIEVEDEVPSDGADPFAEALAPRGGTGGHQVGLALARDLAERQGAALTARPGPAGGTIVELRFRR